MKKYRSILIIILMCLLVLVVGTYAWLSWRSNETGLKLTIGSIDDVRVTISPYKIDSNIIPILSYEEEEYSHIEVINNSAETKNLELYYKINNIDEELISEDFMYTIEKSTDGVTYSKHKEGNFIEGTTESEFVILTESIPTNTEYEYKVYVWLNGENHDQGSFVGKKFSGELRGKITEYVSIFEEYTYEEISLNYACANSSNGTSQIFTYTGDCEVVDDGDGNWKVRLLTSGDFTSNSDMLIDAFLVGGGGGGGVSTFTYHGGGGGGGGYTNTFYDIEINNDFSYNIVVGDGGESNSVGGTTSAFGYSVNGGNSGANKEGGSGGSGGGGGGWSGGTSIHTAPGKGGAYGNVGSTGKAGPGGSGQYETTGQTTCEFNQGTPSGCVDGITAYSGGGGGGSGISSDGDYYSTIISGGEGGGGAGGRGSIGASGITNTGGGGGGGSPQNVNGGRGGSGIVIIRNVRRPNIIVNDVPIAKYTGLFEVIEESNSNWRVKFLTSGILKLVDTISIDLFLVGGGGGGGVSTFTYHGGGGGGGGYTNTFYDIEINNDSSYNIVIGAGGKSNSVGGTTSAFGYSANGGNPGADKAGGSGGSGGGGGGWSGGSSINTAPGKGGAYGNVGSTGKAGPGGSGQYETTGQTTCEFNQGTTSGCDDGVTAYSGGGGGGSGVSSSGDYYITIVSGGEGGGGAGGRNGVGASGITNTGGGGGGGSPQNVNGGIGGTGIVIMRNKR